MASFTQKSKNNQDQDIPLDVGDQSVSCLSFDGINQQASNALIVGSWDTTLSVYDLTQNRKYASLKHDAAVLCCDFASVSIISHSLLAYDLQFVRDHVKYCINILCLTLMIFTHD